MGTAEWDFTRKYLSAIDDIVRPREGLEAWDCFKNTRNDILKIEEGKVKGWLRSEWSL